MTDINQDDDQNDTFIERLAAKLGASSASKTIFHEPIRENGVTIIPVAKIGYGFGGGYGHKHPNDTGKGAGGGVAALPVGYIEIKDGQTTFKSIRQPFSVPSLVVASGFAGYLLFRGILKFFRK